MAIYSFEILKDIPLSTQRGIRRLFNIENILENQAKFGLSTFPF